MSKRILIVDDEKPILEMLKYNLEKEGYETDIAMDGEQAINAALTNEPDLILLDVMLPKADGFTVCKKIRQTSNVPILMLTAKEDVVDKIIGLELGADDYITKPFSIRELMARIKANLRKTQNQITPIEQGEQVNKNTFELDGLKVDFDRYDTVVDTKNVDLTMREFELLKFLANNQGQVYSREQILENVWKYAYYGDVRTVDVTVRRLREKIERNPASPEYILTKRGVGYYIPMQIRK